MGAFRWTGGAETLARLFVRRSGVGVRIKPEVPVPTVATPSRTRLTSTDRGTFCSAPCQPRQEPAYRARCAPRVSEAPGGRVVRACPICGRAFELTRSKAPEAAWLHRAEQTRELLLLRATRRPGSRLSRSTTGHLSGADHRGRAEVRDRQREGTLVADPDRRRVGGLVDRHLGWGGGVAVGAGCRSARGRRVRGRRRRHWRV